MLMSMANDPLGFIGVAWATLAGSGGDGVVALISAACYGIPLGALGGGIGIILILKFLSKW
jgi:hypothetical protein